MIDTIPAMSWSTLPDGPNEYCSKGWMEYTGMKQGEEMPVRQMVSSMGVMTGAGAAAGGNTTTNNWTINSETQPQSPRRIVDDISLIQMVTG